MIQGLHHYCWICFSISLRKHFVHLLAGIVSACLSVEQSGSYQIPTTLLHDSLCKQGPILYSCKSVAGRSGRGINLFAGAIQSLLLFIHGQELVLTLDLCEDGKGAADSHVSFPLPLLLCLSFASPRRRLRRNATGLTLVFSRSSRR